jgi:hypothetical protein
MRHVKYQQVKGRRDSVVVSLQELAQESKEPDGWIFNVIDSGATGVARGDNAEHSSPHLRVRDYEIDEIRSAPPVLDPHSVS